MAETKLNIVIDVINKATGQLQGLKGQIQGLEEPLKQVRNVSAIAFAGLATAIGLSTKQAIDSQSAQNRLVQILKTTHGATKTQIKLLNDQAKALQKVGVVSDDNVTVVQSQLATFDLTVDTLHKLTPSILDYVVAEKGATASTEDFKQMTNGLAQALQGNFASLTRTGFVLDDATKALISNGTEAERTEALIQVLGSTYEGFNESARGTAEGGLQVLRNSFQDLQETIGIVFLPVLEDLVKAITPVIERVTEWVEQNPELTKNLLLLGLAVTGITAGVITFSLALIAVNPIALAIGLVILGLVTIIYTLNESIKIVQNDWDLVWLGMKITAVGFANAIIGIFEDMGNYVIDVINGIITSVNEMVQKLKDIPKIGKVFQGIGEIGLVARMQLGRIEEPTFTGRTNATQTNQTIVTGNTLLSEDVAISIGDMIMKKGGLSMKY